MKRGYASWPAILDTFFEAIDDLLFRDRPRLPAEPLKLDSAHWGRLALGEFEAVVEAVTVFLWHIEGLSGALVEQIKGSILHREPGTLPKLVLNVLDVRGPGIGKAFKEEILASPFVGNQSSLQELKACQHVLSGRSDAPPVLAQVCSLALEARAALGPDEAAGALARQRALLEAAGRDHRAHFVRMLAAEKRLGSAALATVVRRFVTQTIRQINPEVYPIHPDAEGEPLNPVHYPLKYLSAAVSYAEKIGAAVAKLLPTLPLDANLMTQPIRWLQALTSLQLYADCTRLSAATTRWLESPERTASELQEILDAGLYPFSWCEPPSEGTDQAIERLRARASQRQA